MQTVAIDLKSVARERGAHQPRHPLVPAAILAFTRYWMKLSESRPPAWSLFNLVDIQEIAPYITVMRANGNGTYEIEFMGSAVSTMVGEDLTGTQISRLNAETAEIDWLERWRAAAEKNDLNLSTGAANPQYTSRIEFVAADFPFVEDGRADISHVVALTVAKVN
ncbi:MAG: PAS domain-containing protein [Rhodobacteraceae bacterium]|nr:PAS domain-containing protein [Paracoccaceae bacterium]